MDTDRSGRTLKAYRDLFWKAEKRIKDLEASMTSSEVVVRLKRENAELQAKLDAVKALRDELETRELAQYPEHEVSLAWMVIKLDEAIGEQE